jgi:hypothetical protein
MPYNLNRDGTVYVPTQNPDTVNYDPNYAPGEKGSWYSWQQKRYQIVQLDSGAVALNPSSTVAPNTIAFWMNREQYIVTNDRRAAVGGQAASQVQVAGRFGNAVTPGFTCHVQQRGRATLRTQSAAFVGGDSVIAMADSSATADRVALGTATAFGIGVARGPAVLGLVTVDLDIPSIE